MSVDAFSKSLNDHKNRLLVIKLSLESTKREQCRDSNIIAASIKHVSIYWFQWLRVAMAKTRSAWILGRPYTTA